ncbi:hypothetical protein KL86CLO1_11642 [uncultured Eubacteriales bacterium]|uniref:Uncharacterized protein n=1 Tax=uncultured Eubacteriales bacterium TaxID=172733 RepID=A0A212JSJ9_9FIRM|nr:hypothetical protein KL86CLO1_11642 [uncultured Eubacteriales bacterium]
MASILGTLLQNAAKTVLPTLANAATQKANSTPTSGTTPTVTSTTPSNASTAVTTTPTKTTGTDDYGNVDYSKQWDSEMSGAADYNTLLGIYNSRQNKISSGGVYNQFAGDAKSQEMKSILDQMKTEQDNQAINDYIRMMNEENQKAAIAALRNAYQKNVDGLDRTQATIAPEYQSARNEAAGQSELQKRNFAEYAAANGLNSGAGGQAQLSFTNALQGNLSNIASKEASTMADLELQRSQMESDYENAIAQAQAQGNYELAQQLYQEKVRQNESMLQQMQWQAQMDLQNQQLQFSKDQAAIGNDQWNKQYDTSTQQYSQEQAYNLAQYYAEKSGDYSLFKALGLDDAQIQAMKDYNAYLLSKANTSTTSGSYSGTGKESYSKSQYDIALAAAMGGDTSDAVKKIIEGYSGLPFNTVLSSEGYVAPAENKSTPSSSIPQTVLNELARLENTANPTSKIYNTIRQYAVSGVLSDEQAQTLLNKYGLG